MKSIGNFSVNKKSNKFWKFLLGTFVFLFVLYILNIFSIPIKNTFYNLSSPFQNTAWNAGESSSFFLASLFNGGALSKENKNLKEENQRLLSQIVSLQSFQQGNLAQNEVFNACQDSNFSLVMAKVNGLEKDVISIDKGSNDGISVGMPVINQQKVLIGRVSTVYPKLSQVMLISNKNSTIVVKVQQTDIEAQEINGVVKGNGGLEAYLDSVLINNNINVGDVLITSSTDSIFPKDLLVGKILSIEKDDQKSFQQGQVKLFFDINVDNLFVITNYKQTN